MTFSAFIPCVLIKARRMPPQCSWPFVGIMISLHLTHVYCLPTCAGHSDRLKDRIVNKTDKTCFLQLWKVRHWIGRIQISQWVKKRAVYIPRQGFRIFISWSVVWHLHFLKHWDFFRCVIKRRYILKINKPTFERSYLAHFQTGNRLQLKIKASNGVYHPCPSHTGLSPFSELGILYVLYNPQDNSRK